VKKVRGAGLHTRRGKKSQDLTKKKGDIGYTQSYFDPHQRNPRTWGERRNERARVILKKGQETGQREPRGCKNWKGL